MYPFRAVTADGTAFSSEDFNPVDMLILFNSGETQADFCVDVRGDTTVEENETFRVELSSPNGLTLARTSATGTIRNDDTAPLPDPDPDPNPSQGDVEVDFQVQSNWGSGYTANGLYYKQW